MTDKTTLIDNSVLIGYDARPLTNNSINEIVIGYNAVGNGSNTAQIGNSSITNVNTSGSYTGSGFKTPLGTATQFLKADGSVDSATYLTEAGTATNVSGVVAIANGGTGTTNVAGIQSVLGLKSDHVAIGNEAGLTNQSTSSIAIGGGSGRTNQGAGAIGIGYVSGDANQGQSSIAIGPNAAQANQSNQAIAIGYAAGQNNQGQDAIAIGTFAGQSGQAANSIAINAAGTNSPLNPINAGFYVDPIRGASETNSLFYNVTTKEITYGTVSGNFVDLTSNQTVAGVKTFSANGSFNGQKTGKGNATGDANLAVGAGALNGVSSGHRNTALGNNAMLSYIGSGFDNNTSIGYANLVGLTTGSGNTSVGAESMMALGTGNSNTSIGNQSLINTTGSNNIGIGKSSGFTNTIGNNNTIIGTEANVGSNNLSNATALGYGSEVATSNTIQLGNTAVINVKTSGTLTAGTVTYPNSHNHIAGQILITNASGVASWGNPSATVTEVADEYTSTTGVGAEYMTAGKTSFTLAQAPSASSKVKMYVNGIRISNTAYSVSGSTLTYVPANNGGNNLLTTDRVQFDYFY
jgi:hypothetical protein